MHRCTQNNSWVRDWVAVIYFLYMEAVTAHAARVGHGAQAAGTRRGAQAAGAGHRAQAARAGRGHSREGSSHGRRQGTSCWAWAGGMSSHKPPGRGGGTHEKGLLQLAALGLERFPEAGYLLLGFLPLRQELVSQEAEVCPHRVCLFLKSQQLS